MNDLNPKTEFEKKVCIFIHEWFNSKKSLVAFTSGSTGKPKSIKIEKEKMLYSAKNTCDFLNLKQGDTALLALPIEFISGKMMVVRAIERNLKLKIVTPSSTPLQNISHFVDFVALTPLQVENSLDNIHQIQNLIIGGSPISINLKNKIRSVLKNKKNKVFETYGMTETLSHIALKEIFPKNESHFTIFEGINIGTDDRNCLKITAPALLENEIITNDIVEIKNLKEFRFIGRADFVINSGGVKIFPEELEGYVKNILNCEVICIGLPDEKLGEKLILAVEGTKNKSTIEKINLIDWNNKHHRPKEIHFIPKFPRTLNGKILRNDLKQYLIQKLSKNN